MKEFEILKQIDLELDATEESLKNLPEWKLIILNDFYREVKKIMQNFDKVLEVEHFKKTEI